MLTDLQSVNHSWQLTRVESQPGLQVDESLQSTRVTVNQSWQSTNVDSQPELTVNQSWLSTRVDSQPELTVNQSWQSTRVDSQPDLTYLQFITRSPLNVDSCVSGRNYIVGWLISNLTLIKHCLPRPSWPRLPDPELHPADLVRVWAGGWLPWLLRWYGGWLSGLFYWADMEADRKVCSIEPTWRLAVRSVLLSWHKGWLSGLFYWADI